MEEEEKKLKEQSQQMEKKRLEEARVAMEKESHEMRFKRLQHLLEKSNIYSNFLLTKMEQQQAEKIKKDERQKKSKKKRKRDDYKIADVISKEEIMLKAKKMKVEEETASASSDQKTSGKADDPEMTSDSNADIKGRLSEAMRDSAKHLLDPERTVDGKPVPAQQPHLFTGGVMRWYQVEGIEWLRMLWENGINGILADEMGLGKTIQCIAHVAMMVERGVLGPFLVVAPLSTLPNWVREFKRFTPTVPVQLYHGDRVSRPQLLKAIRKPQGPQNMCPVVITSFEIAMIDRKVLQNFKWKYLIVDEGHRIKNLNCRLVQELKLLPTDNKLLLTGTPLQNNLAELWSLLNFLLPEVFDDLKSFESWFDINSIRDNGVVVANEREEKVLNMLHQILTPFLLRRLKTDVTLEIPPKKEVIVYAPLTAKQERFYTAVVDKSISKMLGQENTPAEPTASGRPTRRSKRRVDYDESEPETPDQLEAYMDKIRKEQEEQRPVVEVKAHRNAQVNLKLQNILMLLKRCSNHPYLVEYPLDPATQEFKIDEELVTCSGKFLILDRMLPALKKRGHKVLLFSQMTSILDLLVDYCYLRGYEYSRLDGNMSYSERDENMTKFAEDPEVFLFLLSTRAGGLGINLTSADTVIIFDSDWNPQADLQAQDRCHRIGQTKPVVVYRLVTANTIDQKILERASAKRKLEQMVIHKEKFKGGKADLAPAKSCLDLDELMGMLMAREAEREVKATKGKVISDRDLEDLLDRSDLMGESAAEPQHVAEHQSSC
ncbi:Lymphoid-specific helicase [Merluccius polli]|uniref:Proliferation-associated SNF2-like protein n=1 Tax=Merluccius polli TaxID=89951 RepID=A0AA47NPA1_MERPO|nr:Lymphoid-specific helicase [Merluccius polli]